MARAETLTTPKLILCAQTLCWLNVVVSAGVDLLQIGAVESAPGRRGMAAPDEDESRGSTVEQLCRVTTDDAA